MEHTPYTYFIGWPEHNKFYYGVRYAKKEKCLYESGCHPDEFWVTYHTTSEVVDDFRKKHGEPSIIEVRRTFKTSEEATQWEGKVLKRLKAPASTKWLNKSGGGGCHTPETAAKISKALKGRKFSKEHRQKLSEVNKGKKGHPNQKAAVSKALKGKPKKRESVDKMVEARRKPFKLIFEDKEWEFQWHKDALEVLPDYYLQQLRKKGTIIIPRAHFKHQFKKGDVITLEWL